MLKSGTDVTQNNLSTQNDDTEEKKKKKVEDVEQIMSTSLYLKNRIKVRFMKDVPVKQTQSFLLEQMCSKVDSLFKKFNLSLSNIDYMNDHLKRLNDRVNMDIKKKQLQYPSLLKMEDFKNFEKIANDYQVNREVYLSFSNTEKITQTRQSQQLNEILTTPHQAERVMYQEIALNQYNEVILEKLFLEKKLYQVLLEFVTNRENSIVYEKLFKTLELFETNHKIEMRLLADQFRGINTRMTALQKCEQIIRNTVEHLENDMFKQIGHLDLLYINRKFKELYLPLLQDVELCQIGQYYPSGILFLLMRCGKADEAQRVLSGLVCKDPRLADRFQTFFELQRQDKLDQNDVEEQCSSFNKGGDMLLQQCFWLLLDVSEAFEVLEERQFPGDKDLYIWMTLKTTHSAPEFIEYERNYYESKKTFHHWSLVDLHESIPEYNVALRINIILQRYDYILGEFYKQNNSCIVQVEYFILDAIISTLNIKAPMSEKSKQQQNWIVDNLVNSASVKYPLIACLLLKVHNHDVFSIAKLLAKGNHLSKVLSDQKVQSNLETIFGNAELLNITNIMVGEYFKYNLHNALKEFQQQLDKVNTVFSLHDCHTQLIGKLDEMSLYLKLLIQKKEQLLIETSLYLYHEVQFVQIFSWIVVSQQCTIKLGMLYEKKIAARQLENLHAAMKSVAKTHKLEALLCRFQLIEIFQMAQSLMRVERPSLSDINLMLGQIKVAELTKCLIGERQVELIKMVFWQILQLIDTKKCQDKGQVINQVKEMNETLLRQRESTGLKICEQEVQLNSVVVNILNVYTKVLKMY